MYQFSGKLKMVAIVLMAVGLLGTVISFMNAPSSLEEAKARLAAQEASHHGGHGASHGDDTHHVDAGHKTEDKHSADHKETKADGHDNEKVSDHVKHEVGEHATETVADHAKHAGDSLVNETNKDHAEHIKDSTHAKETVAEHTDHVVGSHGDETVKEHKAHTEKADAAHAEAGGHHADAGHHGDHHAEHAFHQMQNRPWSAVYVSLLFFLGITLLVFAFYAAQRVAQAGWSIALFRVMEAITANIHYVSVIMLVFIILTVMHFNHLFPWMAEGTFTLGHENYDPIVDGKKWFMNVPGWVIRSIFYLLAWNGFRYIIRKKSIQQDNGDLKLHKNLYNLSVGFVVVFMITESMMSWDWIMGIDPHWFSTLFGWYVLATFLVSALTVICLVTLYLRAKGHLPMVNDSHIHDLAKFMFGFSVFWTYLWFAQFMLIWYADMPEETVYYALRFKEYIVPFIGMLALNFIFPILLLINSDFKTVPWILVIGGLFILVGHYVDLFVMIMPGTVGGQWGFGIGEISAFLFFLGLFIFATFTAFSKADPVAKGNPFLHESETHHYYIIEHRGEDNDAHH
ncbi:quinol:cytochrome C oxidoreductase [Tenacibaculum sp. 190524A05c]|uniref:quinol:cytochrome C oxidoreductase n=1 Tax=Tenacibaculum platacis TaxID=3137852 RepID=UPI0031FAB98C